MADTTNDPASLQNLQDIVLPDPVALWPPAPGWYALMIVIAAAVLGWLWYRWRRYRANAYRRAALSELERLRRDLRIPPSRAAAVGALPALLKRTALAVYPRARIAALSGDAWCRFLDETAPGSDFTGSAGVTLQTIAYRDTAVQPLADAEVGQLIDAVKHWLQHHRPPAGDTA